MPIINYGYDNYFMEASTIKSIHLGYRFFQDDIYTFSLYAIPFGGYEVDADDLDSQYRGIDDREYQFMLGGEFKYYNGMYDIETILNAEVGKEGGKVSLKLEKPYVVNADLIIKPSINFNYYNSSLVDYYFGIDSGEASTSPALNRYDGESGYSIGVGLTSSYRLTDAFSLLGFIGIMKFSDEIKNSPVIENGLIYAGGIGIMYTF